MLDAYIYMHPTYIYIYTHTFVNMYCIYLYQLINRSMHIYENISVLLSIYAVMQYVHVLMSVVTSLKWRMWQSLSTGTYMEGKAIARWKSSA